MTAPHFHTVGEAKTAIKNIEHNPDGGNGPPSGIEGGSGKNDISGSSVTPKTKGGDWVDTRGIKGD